MFDKVVKNFKAGLHSKITSQILISRSHPLKNRDEMLQSSTFQMGGSVNMYSTNVAFTEEW